MYWSQYSRLRPGEASFTPWGRVFGSTDAYKVDHSHDNWWPHGHCRATSEHIFRTLLDEPLISVRWSPVNHVFLSIGYPSSSISSGGTTGTTHHWDHWDHWDLPQGRAKTPPGPASPGRPGGQRGGRLSPSRASWTWEVSRAAVCWLTALPKLQFQHF